MKGLTTHISKLILTTIIMGIPMMLLGAESTLSNMEMSLFLDEVETEMIETSHQRTFESALINNALQQIIPAPDVFSSPHTTISDGAIHLMIANVEEEMVESAHREMTSSRLLASALNALAASMKNANTGLSGISSPVHFTVEMHLFLQTVEDEMLLRSRQQDANTTLINEALQQIILDIEQGRENATTFSTPFEGTIPSDNAIDRFINEVETDATIFNTTLLTYSIIPTITY